MALNGALSQVVLVVEYCGRIKWNSDVAVVM